MCSCGPAPLAPKEQTRPNLASDIVGCSAFTIDNESSQFTGTVTISGVSASIDVGVDSVGTFDTIVCYTPITATVGAQFCTYPTPMIVSLAGGARISVSWTSQSAIAILDYRQQD